MNDYRLESPPILRDFLSYHETIKAHSQKTVDEYFLDLRNFFRIVGCELTLELCQCKRYCLQMYILHKY